MVLFFRSHLIRINELGNLWLFLYYYTIIIMAIISDPVLYIGVWVSRAVPLSDQIYGWQMSTGKGGRGNNLWLCTCISSFVSCIHSFFKILIPYWNFDPFIKSFKHFYLLRFVFLLHNFDIQKTIYKYFFC